MANIIKAQAAATYKKHAINALKPKFLNFNFKIG